MKLPEPNIGPWIIRISKHIHIQIFSDVELQSLRTGAPKIRSDYGIFLIIILCKSDTPIFGSDYDPRVFHFPDRDITKSLLLLVSTSSHHLRKLLCTVAAHHNSLIPLAFNKSVPRHSIKVHRFIGMICICNISINFNHQLNFINTPGIIISTSLLPQ